MSKVDHKATRQAMTEQVAAFIANPAGWPAAMAARALRLRSGHPAYSPSNHALIVCQLWGRFAAEGLSDEAAFDAAIRARTGGKAELSDPWGTRITLARKAA